MQRTRINTGRPALRLEHQAVVGATAWSSNFQWTIQAAIGPKAIGCDLRYCFLRRSRGAKYIEPQAAGCKALEK